MSLPRQVQQQLKEVEELENQLRAPEERKTEEVEDHIETTPATPEAATTPEVEKKPEPQPAVDDQKWEQKYRTLDGKYRAEVPQLHTQVKELSKQLETALSQIEELKQKKQPETPPAPLVSDKDREAFGDDLLDVQRRVAQEVFREHVQPLQSELQKSYDRIAQLEQQIVKTSGDVNTLSFEQRLAIAVPDFQQINSSPEFVDWLDEIDPLTGNPRRAYAEYVFGQGDVERVANVVRLFKEMTAKPAEDPRKQELSRQITPPRATANPPVDPGKRIYTEAEASRLFDKVRELNSTGKSDEAKKLENELSLAYIEGRVRG